MSFQLPFRDSTNSNSSLPADEGYFQLPFRDSKTASRSLCLSRGLLSTPFSGFRDHRSQPSRELPFPFNSLFGIPFTFTKGRKKRKRLSTPFSGFVVGARPSVALFSTLSTPFSGFQIIFASSHDDSVTAFNSLFGIHVDYVTNIVVPQFFFQLPFRDSNELVRLIKEIERTFNSLFGILRCK